MKQIQWKLYEGRNLLQAGSVVAESDHDAMALVLVGAHSQKLKDDVSYRIEAGELLASSFGDEFGATAGCVGNDDAGLYADHIKRQEVTRQDQENCPAGGPHQFELQKTFEVRCRTCGKRQPCGAFADVVYADLEARALAAAVFPRIPIDTGRLRESWGYIGIDYGTRIAEARRLVAAQHHVPIEDVEILNLIHDDIEFMIRKP